MNKRSDDIEIVTIVLFIIMTLVIFKLFPAQGKFQEIIAMSFFFIVNPVIFNKLVLKRNFSVFGLRLGNWKEGFIWSGWSLLVSFLIFYIIFNYTSFSGEYVLNQRVAKDFFYFIYYEAILVLGISVIYEFFFRGFVMFSLWRKIGYMSVFAQWLIFLIIISLNSEFSWNFIPYIVFFPCAGFIAYKSKSIYYSFLAQTVYIFFIDVIFIRLAV